MATTAAHEGFEFQVSDHALGRNLPQRIGGVLWLPMLVMALLSFPVAVILGIVRAAAIADGGSETTVAVLGHLVPAASFLGFSSAFAAISFSIARILGEFRTGGGKVQEAAGRRVKTLRMPGTAKAFIALMAMGMMVLLTAVVLHVVAAAAIGGGSASALANADRWAIWLEGVRRIGVAVYLLAIAFGLSTIITVLRFQAVRIGELPDEVRIGG